MDRNDILENFHIISQIEDFEECIQILESVDWNLESALNSIVPNFDAPENEPQFSVPEIESQANYESSYNPSHVPICGDLLFNINHKGQAIKVKINGEKTVTDLANLITSQINEPLSSFIISELSPPYDYDAQLKTLKLQSQNHVFVNHDENPFSGSSSSSKYGSSNSKQFNLLISVYNNDEFCQKLDLTFEGKDTISKVKQHIAALLGTSVNKQKWTGWPIGLDDDITLQSSGISEKTDLQVYISLNPKIFKSTSRPKSECIRPSIETSVNNSRIDEVENDDEDDYYDYPDDMELLENETEWTRKTSVALMNHDAHNDAMVATLHFSNEFSSRYCQNDNSLKPPFFIGTIEDALSNTLYLPPKQRKPLFIYLHHGESIQANIFCTQVLCYHEIILYFTQSDFMIWPWDITYPENKTQLITWLTRNFGSQVVSQFRILLVSRLKKDQFPVLAALGKSQGNVEILEILDGSKSKDEILIRLWDIQSQFQEKQKVDILAWEEQELRKRVKMEQDAAYQDSLSKDQIKEKERDDKKRKIEEDERNRDLLKKKSEEDRNNKMKTALSRLPPEPEESVEAVTIRLRLPPNVDTSSNYASTRRFLYSHTVDHLIAYIESMGFFRTEFKLLMTYPRTDLTQIDDPTITLKSLGIPKRETLILERV